MLRAEVTGQTGASRQHLGVEASIGQPRGDELCGGELLTAQLRVGVQVAAPRHHIRVMGVQPQFDGFVQTHDARLALRSSTRSRCAGVSASVDHRAGQHDRPFDDGRVRARPCGGLGEGRLVHRRAAGVDPDDRMDTRHHLGDVAHIGTAQRERRLDLGGQRRPADTHHLVPETVRQPRVGGQLVVGGLGRGHRVVTAGGDRPGEEAVGHPLLEFAQRRGVVGPHRVVHLGTARNDVGGLAAVGDDAVHHLPGHELLAKQPDRHLRDGDRVDGVDPEVRRHRRM